MENIYNIVKLENLKEYLSQKGISAAILNHPRIYEILDQMSDDLNIVDLSEETQRYIIPRLSILEDGGISYINGMKRVNVRQRRGNLFLKIETYSEKDSKVYVEKRFFEPQGIECIYELNDADISVEDFLNSVGYIPKEITRYERDLSQFNFFIKSIKNARFSSKRYLMQEKPFMLQNIKIRKIDLQSVNLMGNNIDDISITITKDQNEYEVIKALYSKNNSLQEFFKGYQKFNKMYLKDRGYEERIARIMGINLERS